jgi:hypothetical protein
MTNHIGFQSWFDNNALFCDAMIGHAVMAREGMEMSTPEYAQYPNIPNLRAQLHDAHVQLGQAQGGGSKSQFDNNTLFCDAMKRIHAVAEE